MAITLLDPGCTCYDCEECVCCLNDGSGGGEITGPIKVAHISYADAGYGTGCCDDWPIEEELARNGNACEWLGSEVISGEGHMCTYDSTTYTLHSIGVSFQAVASGDCDSALTASIQLTYTSIGGQFHDAQYTFQRDDCSLGVFDLVSATALSGNPPFCSVSLEIAET